MRKLDAACVAVLALCVLLAACLPDWAGKDEAGMKGVPEAAKATILKEAQGAPILKVEKEKAGGAVVYEAKFVRDGKVTEVEVSADGKLLATEMELTLADVPEAVKATIVKEAKGAKIKEIEKETKNGKTVYEAEFVVDGKEIESTVAPDGKLLKREVNDE